MNEQARLDELIDYKILDTDTEIEFDELAEIAAAVCNTPMSIISFIDDKRQWFKAKNGINGSEVNRKETFCQFTLDKPDELLVVENAVEHKQFSAYPSVTNAPFIRFYAGVPLVSPKGNVLGTLCVMNTIPMKLSVNQEKTLRILAKRAMNYLNARKLILKQKVAIEYSAEKLKKLTDQSPCVIYQFKMSKSGEMKFDFISKGIKNLHPTLDVNRVMKNPETAFEVIHPEDLPNVQHCIQHSFQHLTEFRVEYRVLTPNEEIHWHMGRATPEKLDDGTVVWYGTFQNITSRVAYESAMEQIAFDISHVLRRPISTLLGLSTAILDHQGIDETKLKEYINYIKIVSEELDSYTKKLNEVYRSKGKIIAGHSSHIN